MKYNKEKFTLTWSDNTKFLNLTSVKQAYGVCFRKDGKILIVKVKNKWCLPGGKPESNETYEETLKREVMEEGGVELGKIKPLGHIIVRDNKNTITNQLRFATVVSKINAQTIDPAHGEINERKFISPDDFITYCPWGNTGKHTLKKAIEWFKKHKMNR